MSPRRFLVAALCAALAIESAQARSRHGRRRDELTYKCTVLEDAEDRACDGWGYWGSNSPADVRNAVDPDNAKNRVIQLLQGREVAYEFRPKEPSQGEGCVVQWRMWLEDTFYAYIECETSEGVIHLRYVPAPSRDTVLDKDPIIALDVPRREHRWITVRRDVISDLRRLYPKIALFSIRAVRLRGAGYMDDIRIYDYKDQDHDLLPDDFEERRDMDPSDPSDASDRLIEQVIELTDSVDGKATDADDEDEEETTKPEKEPKEPKESKRDKARRYRVALSEAEREGIWEYFEERLAKRLSQAPKPEIGRVYQVRMRTGGEIVGRLEKFVDGRISLRTQHGSLVLPIHRVSRRDTLALFPREAARQMAMRDAQKEVDRLIEEKVEEAEKAAPKTPSGAVHTATAAEAAALFGAPVGATQPADNDKVGDGGGSEATTTAPAPVFRTARVGKPAYDVRPAPTPEGIRPALAAFGEWLKVQHRRVGGRIATRIYAKDSKGNAVLYLVMDPSFLAQDYDVRHRTAVGIQQFWAFRCQGMGVSDLSAAHLVMVNVQGRIVGGSRPEDPADIWVTE
jgi:hypothetical protein